MAVKMTQGNPANPQGANQISPDQLPVDAVALLIWRGFTADTLTLIITKESWEKNKAIVKDDGGFHAERLYEFESGQNAAGRSSFFQIQEVIGWGANVGSSIKTPPKSLKVK